MVPIDRSRGVRKFFEPPDPRYIFYREKSADQLFSKRKKKVEYRYDSGGGGVLDFKMKVTKKNAFTQ